MMKRIYIHGLGQTAHSWDKVIEASDNRDNIVCPDLPGLIGDKEPTYELFQKCVMQRMRS